MNINILLYFLFSIAGGQEVDHTFVKYRFRFHSESYLQLCRMSALNGCRKCGKLYTVKPLFVRHGVLFFNLSPIVAFY